MQQQSGKSGLSFVSSQKLVALDQCQITDYRVHLSTLGYVVP